jgi:hypothetical protein
VHIARCLPTVLSVVPSLHLRGQEEESQEEVKEEMVKKEEKKEKEEKVKEERGRVLTCPRLSHPLLLAPPPCSSKDSFLHPLQATTATMLLSSTGRRHASRSSFSSWAKRSLSTMTCQLQRKN